MTSKEIIKLLQEQGTKIQSQIIKDLISENETAKSEAVRLYNTYISQVPIKERTFTDANKINNKLSNDYRGDIVDGIVGYMFGEPINYSINEKKYKDSELNKIKDEFDSFKLRNQIDDLDSTTGEMMSIVGYSDRLLYIDIEGKERMMHINPWECIVIKDPTIDEVKYGMIYYEIEIIQADETIKKTKVEWYDAKEITFYISDVNGNFILDKSEPKNPKPHLFDYVPVIRFINNNAKLGDYKKVEELIDAYDRTLSDNQNEIEEFRIAYFSFYGTEPDQTIIQKARQTGALFFPEGTDGKFLVKDLNGVVEFNKDHKKTLQENIYKFSKAVDMTDESFSGADMSGESRKWKLVNLENRAKSKERKFVKASREQFKVLCSALQKKKINLNYEDITFQFKRNLPVDLEHAATVTSTLRGNVSEETRLSLLPFIEDPKDEIQKMEQDNETKIDLSAGIE